VSDSTKPIYYGCDNEDIEEFLENYKVYSASKNWDEDKIQQTAIIDEAQASCDIEEKLEQLKSVKQKLNNTIKAYTNMFDACAEAVKNNVRVWKKDNSAKSRKYGKDNEYVVKIPTRTINEEQNVTKPDVNELTSAFGVLKICHVEQNNCSTRMMQPQSNDQMNAARNNQLDNPEVRGMNIYYLEVKESIKDEDNEYLKIKLEKEKSLFDSIYDEISEDNNNYKKGSIIYILISELTMKLDVLKTIASPSF
ncbi:21654_t:CDS:2, partial [Racocetra persica]